MIPIVGAPTFGFLSLLSHRFVEVLCNDLGEREMHAGGLGNSCFFL